MARRCSRRPQAAPAGALALAAVALIEGEKRLSAGASANAADPWGQAQGWRLNGDYRRVLSFGDEHAAGLPGGAYQVGVVYHPQGWELDVEWRQAALDRQWPCRRDAVGAPR